MIPPVNNTISMSVYLSSCVSLVVFLGPFLLHSILTYTVFVFYCVHFARV